MFLFHSFLKERGGVKVGYVGNEKHVDSEAALSRWSDSSEMPIISRSASFCIGRLFSTICVSV